MEEVAGSGVEPTLEVGLGDLVNAAHERGHAHRHSAFGRKMKCALKGGRNDVLQPILDVCRAPEKSLKILHPFEVRDDDTAGVREDIGDHEDAFVCEDAVSLQRRRAIRPFRQDSASQGIRISPP